MRPQKRGHTMTDSPKQQFLRLLNTHYQGHGGHAALARDLGASRNTITNWKRGTEITPEYAGRIATLLAEKDAHNDEYDSRMET